MHATQARAKVNLALHVTGQRDDGYHLLDSLVVFPEIGDRLTAAPADGVSLTMSGPFAGSLSPDADNLVLRAAALLAAKAEADGHAVAGAALHLDKLLPIASGIGGGSADAAATLKLLVSLWDLPYGTDDLADVALRLGADVPMCLAAKPLRAAGIGEILSPLPALPTVWMVLVNPRVAVSTPAAFKALSRRDNPPLPALPDRFEDAGALIAYLAECRNDLEPPALTLAPEIGTVLDVVGASGRCLLARMSGSGATCFGLFATPEDTRLAADTIAGARPDWWVSCGPVLSRTSSSSG